MKITLLILTLLSTLLVTTQVTVRGNPSLPSYNPQATSLSHALFGLVFLGTCVLRDEGSDAGSWEVGLYL